MHNVSPEFNHIGCSPFHVIPNQLIQSTHDRDDTPS